MFIEVLIISLIYSKIKGRKINNLENIKINKWYLILFSFIISTVSLFFVYRLDNIVSIFIEEYFYIIYIFSYILMIICILYNLKYKGFKFMLIGVILNLIPIIFNVGKMPVSEKALNIIGLNDKVEILLSNSIMTHSLSNEFTRFKVLIDFIPIPKPYFFPKVISIGDIVLSIGLFIFITEYTKSMD